MPKPSSKPRRPVAANLTAAAAERGYRRQVNVLRALEDRGTNVPQPVLSGMFRGVRAYPKAHSAVADLLDLTVDQLLDLIDASGDSAP